MIAGKEPVLELLYAVAYGLGYTRESIQVVLIEFVFTPVYQSVSYTHLTLPTKA